MWTRKELKAQAKTAFKRDYWKTVLVTALAVGVLSSAGSATVFSGLASHGSNAVSGGELWTLVLSFVQAYFPALLTILVIASVVALVFTLAVSILLVNPLEVGFASFRMNSLREKGNVGDLGRGFDAGYKRNVGTLFLMWLYTFLWSLLLVVPGIIKAFEYSMIPFLLADHPEMTRQEAFATSKAMMKGNKWKAVVLHLSFILWDLLGMLTLGVVTLLYVRPYRKLTTAALYETLKAQYEAAPAETAAQDA